MFLRNNFQNAFVTNNLHEAMARYDKSFGKLNWNVIELGSARETTFGSKPFSMKVASAWIDGHQVELIEPISGAVDRYLAVLPEDRTDPTPVFHHIGIRRDDEEAMRDEIARLGLPVLSDVSFDGSTFIVIDTRTTIGYYLEYCCMPTETWTNFGWPQDKAVVS